MDSAEILQGLVGEALPPAEAAALIAAAEDDFKAICAREDVPVGAASIVARMAAHRRGQVNAAGLTSESYSGAAESYAQDYPEDLKRAMYRFRRVTLR